MNTYLVDDSAKMDILKDRTFPVLYLMKDGEVYERAAADQNELKFCGHWTYTNDPGVECMKVVCNGR